MFAAHLKNSFLHDLSNFPDCNESYSWYVWYTLLAMTHHQCLARGSWAVWIFFIFTQILLLKFCCKTLPVIVDKNKVSGRPFPISCSTQSWTVKWDCSGFSEHSASLRYCWSLLKLYFQKSLVLWIKSATRILLVFGDGVSEVRENFHRLYHSRQHRCACNSLYAFVCDLSYRWYSTSPVTLTSVNIGSGNGLLPDGTKPLPEPMLTDVRENFHRLYHSRQQRCACNSLYAFVCDLSHRWYSTSPVTLELLKFFFSWSLYEMLAAVVSFLSSLHTDFDSLHSFDPSQTSFSISSLYQCFCQYWIMQLCQRVIIYNNHYVAHPVSINL